MGMKRKIEWFSAIEQLPVVGSKVIVSLPNIKECFEAEFIDTFSGFRFVITYSGNPKEAKKISHWAYMPKPPAV